jgi:hypothetical protein
MAMAWPVYSEAGRLIRQYEPPSPAKYLKPAIGTFVLLGLLVWAEWRAYDSLSGWMAAIIESGITALVGVFTYLFIYLLCKILRPPKTISIYERGISIGRKLILWKDIRTVAFQLNVEREINDACEIISYFVRWAFVPKRGDPVCFQTEVFDLAILDTEYVNIDDFNELLEERAPRLTADVGEYWAFFRITRHGKDFQEWMRSLGQARLMENDCGERRPLADCPSWQYLPDGALKVVARGEKKEGE